MNMRRMRGARGRLNAKRFCGGNWIVPVPALLSSIFLRTSTRREDTALRAIRRELFRHAYSMRKIERFANRQGVVLSTVLQDGVSHAQSLLHDFDYGHGRKWRDLQKSRSQPRREPVAEHLAQHEKARFAYCAQCGEPLTAILQDQEDETTKVIGLACIPCEFGMAHVENGVIMNDGAR
jgi:hypothetical protein